MSLEAEPHRSDGRHLLQGGSAAVFEAPTGVTRLNDIAAMGETVEHGGRYREIFAPGVTAGLMRPERPTGYRNGQVYIRNSMHVPLP